MRDVRFFVECLARQCPLALLSPFDEAGGEEAT